MTTISSTTGPTQSPSVISSGSASFGDNPFLTLLVTQMRQQTPLDPVDNGAFMQQLATFSSMEEQKQINTNLLSLLDFQGALARVQSLGEGSALLGKEVLWQDDVGEQSGTVQSVFVNKDGEVRLKLDGDREIGIRDVTGLRQPQNGNEGN